MKRAVQIAEMAVLVALCATLTAGQSMPPSVEAPPQLSESGHISVAGQMLAYLIHRLPVSSFPELPPATAAVLSQRGCMIPQTYEAHRPENVVHGSLERAGSTDWAVLCATHGTVTLLVFFGSAPGAAMELASAPETERLQAHDPTGVLGFNWGIDPATPMDVHEAQAGMSPRPARVDHDALADSIIEHRTIYHFYQMNTWTRLDTSE